MNLRLLNCRGEGAPAFVDAVTLRALNPAARRRLQPTLVPKI
jgi:hypothetical protein